MKYVMYADDTCVFYENKNLNENIELLNTEFKNVCDWMDANRLTVNSEKSNYIIFSRVQKILPPLEHENKLKECVLTRVNCTKYLGICIDEYLEHHVNSLTSKLSKYVPVFYKIRSQIDKNSLKLLYNSLIYSNLIYCNSVWGAGHANTLQPLFLVQKKIVRAITNSVPLEHTAPLFRNFFFLNIFNINLYMCGLYMYKCLAAGNDRFTFYNNAAYTTRRTVQPANFILS